MSLNAHKALQLFYTQTRDELRKEDIVEHQTIVPPNWNSFQDKLVPVETTIWLTHTTKGLVTLLFSAKYLPIDRNKVQHQSHVVELITISRAKAIEVWAKYITSADWVSNLIKQTIDVATDEFANNRENSNPQKVIHDAYIKAYQIALPEPVVLLLDDLDHSEEAGPSLNLAQKFTRKLSNINDLQVSFSVKKNTLKLDVLGSEVSTYRLRPDVENSLTFTFYEPK